MSKEKEKQLIDFIPVKELSNFHFLVKDYQRGYKWEEPEITALLKDIDQHKDGKYCLQPIIVQTQPEGIEVIDGQQRLTSIYLILYYLHQQRFYTLDYQTRASTQVFLKDKMDLLYKNIIANKTWSHFITEYKEYDNVDVFHIYNVFTIINKWFAETTNKDNFAKKLKEKVYIIWYDVQKDANNLIAEQVFLNLNAGKIPLTNSELIKALFVLDTQHRFSKDIAVLKAYEITNEWDIIENQLHNNSFWYFICDNDYYDNQDTRIDFIIDLANGIKPSKNWDGKDAYRIYEANYFQKKALNWSTIKQTFNKLSEWFGDNENKELYHYIGYIINTKIATLADIINISKGVTKIVFKKQLLNIIKKEFKKKDKQEVEYYLLDNLDYLDHRVACQNILLLLNVEHFINDVSDNKFPFDLYKTEKWSVEHINPQNPKDFKDIETVKNWLKSFKFYFENKKIEEVLVNDITSFLEEIKDADTTKRITELRLKPELSNAFQLIIERITSLLELHKIANLTLLDRNTNSKLGNKVFIEKRKEILKLIYKSKEEKVFIPESTKDVFTKNYTKDNQSIIDEIFGFKDMTDYKNHISLQLNKYFEKL